MGWSYTSAKHRVITFTCSQELHIWKWIEATHKCYTVNQLDKNFMYLEMVWCYTSAKNIELANQSDCLKTSFNLNLLHIPQDLLPCMKSVGMNPNEQVKTRTYLIYKRKYTETRTYLIYWRKSTETQFSKFSAVNWSFVLACWLFLPQRLHFSLDIKIWSLNLAQQTLSHLTNFGAQKTIFVCKFLKFESD